MRRGGFWVNQSQNSAKLAQVSRPAERARTALVIRFVISLRTSRALHGACTRRSPRKRRPDFTYDRAAALICVLAP